MTVDVIVPETRRGPYERFHYAPGVRAGGLVILSGQLGLEDGRVPNTLKAEFRAAWQHVGEILGEAGLGFEHIVEYTTYHVGLQAHLQEFMAVRDEFLQAPWPAWTAIGIAELAVPGAHVEIRALALQP